MIKEFCPRCGKKEFEYLGSCETKWRCNSCRYFLMDEDFKKLKIERGVAFKIFNDIEKAIEKTKSETPVKIEDSQFLKELKKIKKKYLK